MKAIILAAGEGQRLRPLTENMPKVMITVGNKPILQYVIEALVDNNIRDITIVVGYHSEKIRQYFRSGRLFGAEMRYVLHKKQLGTAHALYQAKTDKEFILLHGDNIISKGCISAILKSEKNSILGIFSRASSKYGIIEHAGKTVNRIIEKPLGAGENLIFTGIGHFDAELFDLIKEFLDQGIYDLPEVLNSIRGLKLIRATDCVWKDAIYPWDLLELNSWVMKKTTRCLSGKIESANIIGDVEIGAGTTISAGCHIRGPVRIGKNCYIGPNSVILPYTSIGNDVSIGALSFIKNSIIMSSTSISHQASIEGSVIGRGCVIDVGFMAMSSRFQKIFGKEVMEVHDGGIVLGDDCKIGAKVTVVPGIRIKAGMRIGAIAEIKEEMMEEV